jgi:UDP-N-acetylmuramyl tripeptide synthase
MIIVSIILFVLLIAAVQYARGVDMDNTALTADNLRLKDAQRFLRTRIAEVEQANHRLGVEKEVLAQEVQAALEGERIAIAQRDEANATIITLQRRIAELEGKRYDPEVETDES